MVGSSQISEKTLDASQNRVVVLTCGLASMTVENEDLVSIRWEGGAVEWRAEGLFCKLTTGGDEKAAVV